MTDIVTLQSDTNLFGDAVADAPNIDREPLAAGLYQQLKDISLEEFCSYFINGFDAMVDYANLCAGEKTGQRISLLFNPHRLDTGTKRFPISLYAALKDERFVRGLARVVLLNQRKGNTKDLLYASVGMGVQGTSYVQEFPPHVARDLALEYGLTKDSLVLDPCAGWGGRMLGFSAVVNSYTCCEPSSRTVAGLRKLVAFIHSFRREFNAIVHEAPFEDVQLQNGLYDFALTSPPYYDTEWYAPGEVANSFNRYSTFEAWCAGFYAPLIHRTMAALKPGAAFVINIGSRIYPLNDKLREIAEGHYRLDKQKARLSASNGLGKSGEGETFYELRNPTEQTVVALNTEALTSAESVLKPDTEETAPALVSAAIVEPVASAFPSALSFALSQSDDELSDSTTVPTVTSTPRAVETAAELAVRLTSRGHRLLTRDGKLFISESSALSDDDRAAVKTHKPALIALAMPWEEDAPMRVEVSPHSHSGSLAHFLGHELPKPDASWRPDEPPQLDGIDNIIVNLETDGLEWQHGHKAIGITVGSLDGQFVRFLPFAFKGGGNLDPDTVKRWYQREVRNKHITNAHTSFDVHMSRGLGVDLEEQGNTVSDVMHYAALIDDHRKKFALDVLAQDYLGGVAVDRLDESIMAEYHASEVAPRAAYQATLVSQLREKMWPLLDAQDLQRVRQLEDDVIYPVVEMEKNGSPINMPLLAEMKAECEAEYQKLIIQISEEVGFPFSHTTSDWRRVFEKYGLGDSDSYDEEVINDVDHPVVKLGHRASQYASLNSKIFTPYSKMIGSDGILWYELNQLKGEKGGTVSGRISAPYVHQVPNIDNHFPVFGDRLFPRKLFVSGLEGYDCLEADAAQIEYRIFAHHAKNPKILKAYQDDPLMSFHKHVWKMMLPYKPDLDYTAQKRMNFMKIYGGQIVKTAVLMGFISSRVGDEIKAAKTQKTDPRLAQAREVERIYARELPEVDFLIKKSSHLAMSYCDDWCKKSRVSRMLHKEFPHRGYIRTTLGRRARFPDNYSLHKALNRAIQGTGADIMKRKMVELHRRRKETGFIMRRTTHDAVGGSSPNAECVKMVAEILNHQSFPELIVPILWEINTGASWADCK